MRYQVESYLHQSSFPFSSRKLIYSVDARLNALEPRLSWFYIRLLLLTGVAWAIQAAELVLLIFTQSLVANDIGMGERVLDIHNASIFMGSVVGGPIFGHVADRFGRRITLVIAMVFTLGGLAVSAAANTGYLLIIGRIIAGLGFGGQHSATVVLIQELAPRSIRGRLISLLDASTGIGGLVGVALAFALAPWLEWRITYLVVCGFVLYALVLWFTMPESPRWLASVGRTEEAFDIVEKIELVHCLKPAGENVPKENLGFMSVQEVPSSAVKPSRLKRLFPTLILWTLWIAVTLSFYGLGAYVPILIGLKGYNVFASWSTICVLNIAQVVGSVAAAGVLDTYGLHRCIAVFGALAAAFSIALSYLTWSRAIVITITFFVVALLSSCWSCVLAYTPGHYTTAYRGQGMGYAVGISRLAVVGATYLYPHMYNVWDLSVPAFCWIFGGVLTIVAVGVVPRFGYKANSLDDNVDQSVWIFEVESGVQTSVNVVRAVGTNTIEEETVSNQRREL